MKDIYLIGAGGHARVVLDVLRRLNYPVQGCFDARAELTQSIHGVPVLGSDAELMTFLAQGRQALALGLGVVRGGVSRRQTLYQHCVRAGAYFPTLVHPETVLGAHVNLADGVQLMAGVIVQTETQLGENVLINTGAIIEHECRIGAHSHIAPGAVLGGQVSVGERTLIGLGARVLPQVRIGHDVTVGAGSVVLQDVPDGMLAYGVPARFKLQGS